MGKQLPAALQVPADVAFPPLGELLGSVSRTRGEATSMLWNPTLSMHVVLLSQCFRITPWCLSQAQSVRLSCCT